MATFFKVVVQVVILFVSETWVITPCMGQLLEGFHHRVARELTEKLPRRLQYVSYYYPPWSKRYRRQGWSRGGSTF